MNFIWKQTLRALTAKITWLIVGCIIGFILNPYLVKIRDFRARVSLHVKSVAIVRMQPREPPQCRIAYRLYNGSSSNKTVSFDEAAFLDGHLKCRLNGKTREINLLPQSPWDDTLTFATFALDSFLKVPQGHAKTVFALTGVTIQDNRSVSASLLDSNVDKATYWQMPVVSLNEALRMPVVMWTFSKEYRPGHIPQKESVDTIFVNTSDTANLGVTTMSLGKAEESSKGFMFNLGIDVLRLFRGRWGGSYIARSPSSNIVLPRLQEALPDLSSRAILSLTGLEYEPSLIGAYEFVYMSFDQRAIKSSAAEYQRNSSFFVMIAKDTGLVQMDERLFPLDDTLRAHGFRTAVTTDSLFRALPQEIYHYANPSALRGAADRLNWYTPIIDSALSANLPLIVWLGSSDSVIVSTLTNIVSVFCLGKRPLNLFIDIRPFNMSGPNLDLQKRPFEPSQTNIMYCDHVVVMPEFSDATRAATRWKYGVDERGYLFRSITGRPPARPSPQRQ